LCKNGGKPYMANCMVNGRVICMVNKGTQLKLLLPP
jgi:hypothetical protein